MYSNIDRKLYYNQLISKVKNLMDKSYPIAINKYQNILLLSGFNNNIHKNIRIKKIKLEMKFEQDK